MLDEDATRSARHDAATTDAIKVIRNFMHKAHPWTTADIMGLHAAVYNADFIRSLRRSNADIMIDDIQVVVRDFITSEPWAHARTHTRAEVNKRIDKLVTACKLTCSPHVGSEIQGWCAALKESVHSVGWMAAYEILSTRLPNEVVCRILKELVPPRMAEVCVGVACDVCRASRAL